MKKTLLVFLCFLFLVPAAYAQDTQAYVPGEITQALFAQAFDQGDMLLADIGADVTFSENAASLFEADPASLSALSEALKNTTLTIGAGKTEDGIRLQLAGKYAVGDQQAALDATLDLTAEGVIIMSSAMPGERLSIQWTTLLELADLDPQMTAPLLMLGNPELANIVTEALDLLTPMIDAAAQIAAPYGETVLAHLNALPIEVFEDVPAEYGYPAAATEVNISINAKHVGDLLVALSDQLEADASLCVIFDAMLAQSGETITTKQLCAAVREAAQSMTDETPVLSIITGMNEIGEFLYLHISTEVPDSPSLLVSLINTPYSEDPSKQFTTLNLLTLSEDGATFSGVSLNLAYPQEAAANVLLDSIGALELYDNSECVLSFEFILNEGLATTEDGQLSILGSHSISLAIAEEGVVSSVLLKLGSMQSTTPDGGEQSALSGSMAIAEADMQIPLTFQVNSLTSIAQDGPKVVYTSAYQAPDMGVTDSLTKYTLYTAAHTPDVNVTEIILETATPEALDALAQRVMLSLENTVTTLIQLLPSALTQGML